MPAKDPGEGWRSPSGSRPGMRSVAQTAFRRAPSLVQPQAADSAWTTCRPRPASADMSGEARTGAPAPGSVTAHTIWPDRRHRISSTRSWTAPFSPQAPCRTAFVTSSDTITDVSSTRQSSPQLSRICRVKSRAAAQALTPSSSGQKAT